MKTLPVSVYRPSLVGDCTNGGVTARNDVAYLICDEGWRETDGESEQVLRLVRTTVGGHDYIHAEQVSHCPEGCVGPMFGGNFIYTCDSRFPSPYPIPVHDRYETQELYDLLSR